LVAATREWKTQILCTRKTNPGLRELEVAAVRHGGGDTFRSNLSEGVLIKDNHLGLIGGVEALWERLKANPGNPQQLRMGKLEVASMYELELAGDRFCLIILRLSRLLKPLRDGGELFNLRLREGSTHAI
jgi:nicotinate-nucleotide pyrophosphorylase (carboxylating)